MLFKKSQLIVQVIGGMTIGLLAIWGLLTLLGSANPAWAAVGNAMPNLQHEARVPNVLTYQGILRQPDGTPLNGTYTMTFRLYNEPIGGELKHTEPIGNVVVRDGLFTVLLGDTVPIDSTAFKGPMYISVQVGDEAEMAPRQRIAPVAYAVQLTDGVYVDEAGEVGIGTTDPQTQLDVNGDVIVRGAIEGNLNVNGRITSLATESGNVATTLTTKDYVDTKWPDGHYCILRADGACPAGFTVGNIYTDGEDSDPSTSCSGTYGDSSCSSAGSNIVFCCK